MLSWCKKKRLVCFVVAIVMILVGCSTKEKAEPTNGREQAETKDMPSSFMLIISETDNCRVLSLTAIEETPNALLHEQSNYLFSQGTKNGNEVMFSCEGMTEKCNSKYKLLLSLGDSDLKFLCIYTFENVTLTNNARIDLSNVLHGQITISANDEGNTYAGFISAIS